MNKLNEYVFSIVFLRSWVIFTIITLNSFSGRLPVSTSSSCFPGVLSCPSIWDLTCCFFVVINFLNHTSGFSRCGTVVLLAPSDLWWRRLPDGRAGPCTELAAAQGPAQ